MIQYHAFKMMEHFLAVIFVHLTNWIDKIFVLTILQKPRSLKILAAEL